MAGERTPALTALVVGAVAVVLAGLVLFWGPIIGGVLLDDRPRSFDARELDPLLAGTEVVEPPAEGCPQGREPVGDCDAGARVRGRDGGPVVDVIAANAEAAGFVGRAAGSDLYRAQRGERCLSVDATRSASDAVVVVLSWC